MINSLNLNQISDIAVVWAHINRKDGLSKISNRYFRNNLDCMSSRHEMTIRFKTSRLNNIYGYHNTKRYMSVETHSNCHSISDCNSSGNRFFRRK